VFALKMIKEDEQKKRKEKKQFGIIGCTFFYFFQDVCGFLVM
jgi:hypothetical protein